MLFLILQRNKTFPERAKPLPIFSDLIMGINHIQLSRELIAMLYPESLVSENDTEPAGLKFKSPDVAPQPVYDFMGKHQRSVCFLVDFPGQEYMPQDQLQFLNRILDACKYSLDDIALVNAARAPVLFADLEKQLKPRILFLWGIRPESIGLDGNLPEFSISMVENISVIPINKPELMTQNSPEGLKGKQLLWICLKKLFNL
jgi:hypothetical protein